MKKQNQNGITLIALVITIIVLLILASVSIAMITGENGILYKAENSKKDTEMSEIIERAKLDIADWQIQHDGKITDEEVISILNNKYGKVSDDNTILITDKNYEIEVSKIWNVKINPKPKYGLLVNIGKEEFSDEYDLDAVPVEHAVYNLCFVARDTQPSIGETYENGTIEEVYNEIENTNFDSAKSYGWDSNRKYIKEVKIQTAITPINTAYMFYDLILCKNFENLELIDTSKTKDMSYMFYNVNSKKNYNNELCSINGIENWNTSNVTAMKYMFYECNSIYLNSINKSTFSLDLSKWNTSNVKDVNNMFYSVAFNADSFNLNLSNWDVSKVTDMNSMFNYAGGGAESWNIEGLENWDTSNVTNMSFMFAYTAAHDKGVVNFSFVENWNVSNVNNMSYMFSLYGYAASEAKLDLSKWDVKNVTNMSYMFNNAGHNMQGEKSFYLNLSSWDTSSVEDMSRMFYSTGNNATNLNLVGLEDWNTSKVTNMNYMFNKTGKEAINFSLNLSKWNVANVTQHADFNKDVTDKIIAPW